jgi:hypothetical protein
LAVPLRRREAIQEAEMTDRSASGLIVFLLAAAVQKPIRRLTAVFSLLLMLLYGNSTSAQGGQQNLQFLLLR